MTPKPHQVAFYADLFYDSPLSPPSWIPPRDLDPDFSESGLVAL